MNEQKVKEMDLNVEVKFGSHLNPQFSPSL